MSIGNRPADSTAGRHSRLQKKNMKLHVLSGQAASAGKPAARRTATTASVEPAAAESSAPRPDFPPPERGRSPEPNFEVITPALRGLAWNYWHESNGFEIAGLAARQDRGELLFSNTRAFRDKGIYEAVLAFAFSLGPHLHPNEWRYLFSLADRTKLLAQGDPIPTKPITVYRGVSHCGHRLWIRGLSWSMNPNTAAWFATRFPSPYRIPAVYSVRVRPEQILLVLNDRGEEEVVVEVSQLGRLKRLNPMPESVYPP